MTSPFEGLFIYAELNGRILDGRTTRHLRRDDLEFFGTQFAPPLPVGQPYAFVVRDAKWRLLFAAPLVPGPPTRERVLFDHVYVSGETHTIEQSESRETIVAAYIQMEEGGALRVHVDMELDWIGRHFPSRFVPLPFTPPALSGTLSLLQLDPRTVKQRTPLWKRFEVSGTKASTLFGYNIPKDPTWQYGARETHDASAIKRMRAGASAEVYAMMLYMCHRSYVKVSVVGSAQAPPPYPVGWGASPDGLLDDPSTTPNEGVLEIKTTMSKNMDLKPSYFPQVYMEMIATDRQWCDIVRYRNRSHMYAARIYRVYRDPKVETLLYHLLRYAHYNRTRLREIIDDDNFTEMRRYFEDLSKVLPYQEVHMTPAIVDLFAAYDRYVSSVTETTTRAYEKLRG